jgi:hypothetical protein
MVTVIAFLGYYSVATALVCLGGYVAWRTTMTSTRPVVPVDESLEQRLDRAAWTSEPYLQEQIAKKPLSQEAWVSESIREYFPSVLCIVAGMGMAIAPMFF